MNIVKDMHPSFSINSWYEFNQLKRMLSEAIERGYVEEVPVMLKPKMPRAEKWYREKETGVIYSLTEPDPPISGWWEQVDVEQLKRTDYRVQ